MMEITKIKQKSKRRGRKKRDFDPCKTCVWRASESLRHIKCDYIGITGKRRPCPPGEECSVYEFGKRRGKDLHCFRLFWAEDDVAEDDFF